LPASSLSSDTAYPRLDGDRGLRGLRHRSQEDETLSGEAKHILALTRLRLCGLSGARDEFLLTASVQN